MATHNKKSPTAKLGKWSRPYTAKALKENKQLSNEVLGAAGAPEHSGRLLHLEANTEAGIAHNRAFNLVTLAIIRFHIHLGVFGHLGSHAGTKLAQRT